MSKFRFQAHRGDSKFYPENTIPAFAAAIEQGYDIIEIDTKFTKDNVCVLMHDASVNRTGRRADGSEISAEKLPISKLTFDEVREFDFGLFKGEEFKGTKIPTLAEALAFIKGKGVQAKLDNIYQGFNEEQFEIFCSVIEAADMEEQICFTCKTLPYFRYLAERFPKAEMHFDGSLTPSALAECKKMSEYRRVTVWIPYDNEKTAWFNGRKADAEFCRELHQYGDVGIWVIGTVEELRRSKVEFGADLIETNGELKPYMLNEI